MIIVDATHSKSSAKHETPTQILRRMTKELRKELYRTQYELSEKFPEKPIETADLSEEIEYSNKLIEAVKKGVLGDGTVKARKALVRVEELLENDRIKEIQSAVDEDAKLGYKSEPEGADCSVQAVVDYYGPTALGREWPGLSEGDKGVSDPNAVQSPMLGAFVFSKQGRARAAVANPVTYIDGSEPPFLLLHGDADEIVPFRQSIYLRDALEAAGVPVSMHRVHGGGHGFAGADITAVIDTFLDYWLKPGK